MQSWIDARDGLNLYLLKRSILQASVGVCACVRIVTFSETSEDLIWVEILTSLLGLWIASLATSDNLDSV